MEITNPDIVWAVCTSNMNGLIAGRIISNFFKCKLVLEFQDPPSSNKEVLINDLEIELIKTINRSDGVVTTSNSFKQYIIDNYSYPEYKIKTIYLTYNEELITNCAQKKISDQLVLLHAGSLKTGKRRNGRSIIEAISLVYSKRPDIKDKIKFWMIGGGEGAEEVVLIAEKMKISSSVKNTPEMPSDYVAKIMNEIDVNLVIKHDLKEFDMQIPGKLFQCIGLKKPVLGIMREKTEAASILQKTGLGLICENSNIENICSALIYLYDNRFDFDNKFCPDENYIQKFSVKQLGIDCNKFLRKILLS